jgi:ABC-type transport system substrate-binding protein
MKAIVELNAFRNAIVIVLLLLGGARTNPSHAKDGDNEQGSIKIQVSNFELLPWHYEAAGAAAATYRQAVHSRPVFINSNFEIKPGYIRSWKWDYKDNKFIFTMDDRLKYHNGRPISAFDFEFVLIKPFLGTVGVSDQTPLMYIKGITKLKRGSPFKSGMVEGIKVKDDNSIEAYLERGRGRFLYTLASFVLAPLAPIDEFAEDLYSFKGKPIGCGNYRVVEFDAKTGWVKLEKIEGHKGPKIVELYSSGTGWNNRVDIAMGGGVAQMKDHLADGYSRLQGESPYAVEILDFNYSTAAGQNEDFRKAVALSMNKEWQLRNYPGEVATDQIVTSLTYGKSKTKSYYDPKEAKRIVNRLPKSIRNQTHAIMYHGLPDKPVPPYMIDILKDLETVGLKAKAIGSKKMKLTGEDKNISMIIHGRVVDSDPLMSFAYYLPDGGFPLQTPTNDQKVLKLFQKADEAESVEDRGRLIKDLSDYFREKHIQVPISERYPVYYISKKIKSLGLESNAFDLNLENIETH